MNMRQLLLAALSMLIGWGTAGVAQSAPTVSFEAGDRPGNFFTCSNTGTSGNSTATPPIPPAPGCVNATAGQRSLAIIRPGDTVGFPTYGGEASTIHTALSLIWPLHRDINNNFTNPAGMPFKTAIDFRHPELNKTVQLNEPGLYVFICDIHVYMFAAVIVDDHTTTAGFDLGRKLTLVNNIPFPTYSDLALRLLRTFFIVTDPGNWKDYTKHSWVPSYPAVPVIVYDNDGNKIEAPGTLFKSLLEGYDPGASFDPSSTLFNPGTAAVGEIWVNTQFELTAGKSKPGTATAINGADWKLTKKVALPAHNMNHPHNMWTDKNQEVIYQTQWFDERMAVFNRTTGAFIRELNAGPAPSHVMTRADNDQVHVAQNGDNYVREFEAFAPARGSAYSSNQMIRDINMGGSDSGVDHATHPHGHWMSADGKTMVTPNENVWSSTIYEFVGENDGTIRFMPSTGAVPIATGMMPDSSKYYVANLLDNSITVIDPNSGAKVHPDIDLLKIGTNYFPLDVAHQGLTNPPLPVGALPIQTPVSPDGTNMVTANTLTGTITVVDTRPGLATTDTVVKMLPCDPGCHGVQYGAKAGGGYYAYVASKFSNALIVVDPAPGGNPANAAIVGRVLLAGKAAGKAAVQDDTVIGNPGMGGQGVLPVPLAYNGWVQQWVQNCKTKDCKNWSQQLTSTQKNPGPVQ